MRRRRRPRLGGGDVGQVLDDFLRVLSLARPRLARAQDALVLSVWNRRKIRLLERINVISIFSFEVGLGSSLLQVLLFRGYL